ncbi:hypothetical protein G6F43_010862 [Rhizopus delemar]|nr:hypothetical protein G6F43_010862 [Rhizopus delemar]
MNESNSNDDSFHDNPKLSRHPSFLYKRKPIHFQLWLSTRKRRSLSVPDLHKLKKEWDLYQQVHSHLDNARSLQIDLLNIRTYTTIKRPQMRVKMGALQYYSKCVDVPTGEWNEGFIFTVSYHAQLFNTVEFDLYDKPSKLWPSSMKHVGKAKLKLSSLAGRNEVFVTFIPIYEYHSHRLLPSDYKSKLVNIVDPNTVSKKIGDLHLIGSIQVRIRYRFQQPIDTPDCLPTLSDKQSSASSLHSITSTKSTSSSENHNDRKTSYGQGELAQSQEDVNDLFQDRLTRIMSTRVPSEQSLKAPNMKHESEDNVSPSDHHHHFSWLFRPLKDAPKSSRGRRYGFSQTDSDDHLHFNPDNSQSQDSLSLIELSTRRKLTHKARKKAKHIIHSVNFGDRDFATQWMQDSFNDIAISYPMIDKLVGMVVSKQTRAMVRAIIKTANEFGQGFRVTGFQLLKAALFIQKFYETLPPAPVSRPVQDIALIDYACHYFGYALIAYGWRGLYYLGAYAQYMRGFKDRRSNRMAIIRYLQLNPEDLLGYEYALRKGASFQPSYFIAIDRSRKSIVLSIRGTWSLYDAITDLVCEYRPWKKGLVHSGMLASAQWFYTSIIPQIFRYISHHHKELDRFIITGHSLGGGTAGLLTMMVADQIDQLREIANNPLFDLHCYNYAPTAACSEDLAKQYEQFIHSFICHDDIVGRLSYGSAMKLKELILDTISTYNTLGGFRKTITHHESRKVCLDIIGKRRDELNNITKSMYPSLYIPGKIVQIRREKDKKKNTNEEKDDGYVEVSKNRRSSVAVMENISKHLPGANSTQYSLHYTASTISDEMALTKTCIEDHMITAYYEAFTAIKTHYLKDK